MNNTTVKTKNDFEVMLLEKCVVCNKQTDVPINLNTNLRCYYIDGAGQLCEKCYNNLDDKKYIRL